MERVNFHLTEGERKKLEVLSEVTGITKAELIRRAIDEFVDKKRWAGVTGLAQLKEIYA